MMGGVSGAALSVSEGRFTSEVFYESLLAPEERLSRQALRTDGPLGGTGLRFDLVAHTGNDVESPEEAHVVAAMARSLVEGGAMWVNAKGRRCRITSKDVVIVAPFNAQMAAIAERLPPRSEGRHGGQVPRTRSAGQHLLDDVVHRRGRATRNSFLYSRHRSTWRRRGRDAWR
jgi:hypothetical protein